MALWKWPKYPQNMQWTWWQTVATQHTGLTYLQSTYCPHVINMLPWCPWYTYVAMASPHAFYSDWDWHGQSIYAHKPVFSMVHVWRSRVVAIMDRVHSIFLHFLLSHENRNSLYRSYSFVFNWTLFSFQDAYFPTASRWLWFLHLPGFQCVWHQGDHWLPARSPR